MNPRTDALRDIAEESGRKRSEKIPCAHYSEPVYPMKAYTNKFSEHDATGKCGKCISRCNQIFKI